MAWRSRGGIVRREFLAQATATAAAAGAASSGAGSDAPATPDDAPATDLDELGRTVEGALAGKRIGRPVFVRYTLAETGKARQIVARLARMTQAVRRWIGQPPARLYAVGSLKEGPVSLTVQLRDGASALLSVVGGKSHNPPRRSWQLSETPCAGRIIPCRGGQGRLGKEQIAYARRVLAANRGVRWTIVAMHKPVWTAAKVRETGWLDIEDALGDRPYTVFVGHVHRYRKFVRNGRNYYQLATTGGVSKMRGLSYGEFDHIVWVTMKKDGPVLANVLLDAVLREDLSTPETNEPGVSTANRKPTEPVRGQLFFEGVPASGAYVVFQKIGGKDKRRVRADGMVEADGSFRLSTYRANDGAPEGDYAVTVVWRKPFVDAVGRPGPNVLPQRYAKAETSGLKAAIKAGPNDLILELRK